MIYAKPPEQSYSRIIGVYLDNLPFMPRRGEIVTAISDLMVEAHKEGYLLGVSDQLSGNVRQEDS